MKLDDFNSTFNSVKVSKVLEDKFGTRVDLNNLNLRQLKSLKSNINESHKKMVKSMPFNSGHRNPAYLEQVALLEAIELRINEVELAGEGFLSGVAGATLGGITGGPVGAIAGGYLGSKIDQDEKIKEIEDKDRSAEKKPAFSNLSGSQTSALRMLVGPENITNAKNAIRLAKQGKSVPANMMKGFAPIVDMLLDVLQGGSSYARRLQALDKQATKAFHLDESKSFKVMVRHGTTKDSKDHMPITVKAVDRENASAKAMDMAKKKKLKYPKVSSITQLDESRYLFEGETEKAQLIMAVKDMVDRVQGMVEDLNKMKVEDLVALTDKMRDEFGQDQATSFTSGANDILSSSIDALTNSRTEMDNAVLALTGEAPATVPGAEIPPADLGSEVGPELPAAPGEELPAPEGGEELGRELRESRSRTKKRILESSRFLGKLAK
jgi:hypothetical protein